MSDSRHPFAETLKKHAKQTRAILTVNAPGMRVIKTTIAVVLSTILQWVGVSQSPYGIAITSIICMQQDLSTTWKVSRNRILGTVIAGLYSYLFLMFFTQLLNIKTDGLLYHALVGLFILPLMQVLILMKAPGGIVIGSVVYLLICLSEGARLNPLQYSVGRIVDSLIGISFAMFLNWLPILNKWGDQLVRSKEKALETLNSEREQE